MRYSLAASPPHRWLPPEILKSHEVYQTVQYTWRILPFTFDNPLVSECVNVLYRTNNKNTETNIGV